MGEWIRAVAGGAMLTALLLLITPEGGGKKVLGLACGTVLALVLVSPLSGLGPEGLAARISSLAGLGEVVSPDHADIAEDVQKEILKERIEAYILDKAAERRLDCTASAVIGKNTEGQHVVAGVTITLKAGSPEPPAAFAEELRAELGLPQGQPVLQKEGDGT